MRTSLSIVAVAILAAGSITLSSCTGVIHCRSSQEPAVVVKSGPPPHAPAHGYRQKHEGVALVFNSDLGLYVVDGHAGHYYYESHFYRVDEGVWQMSVHFEGPWKAVSRSKLPPGLQKDQHAKANKKK